jgi:hypothetical protein
MEGPLCFPAIYGEHCVFSYSRAGFYDGKERFTRVYYIPRRTSGDILPF